MEKFQLSINLFTSVFTIIGLVFDMIGVFMLFSTEPIQIKAIDYSFIQASPFSSNNDDTNRRLIDELNKQIKQVNRENGKRERKAKKFRCWLMAGFVLQFISAFLVLLSYFLD